MNTGERAMVKAPLCRIYFRTMLASFEDQEGPRYPNLGMWVSVFGTVPVDTLQLGTWTPWESPDHGTYQLDTN